MSIVLLIAVIVLAVMLGRCKRRIRYAKGQIELAEGYLNQAIIDLEALEAEDVE